MAMLLDELARETANAFPSCKCVNEFVQEVSTACSLTGKNGVKKDARVSFNCPLNVNVAVECNDPGKAAPIAVVPTGMSEVVVTQSGDKLMCAIIDVVMPNARLQRKDFLSYKCFYQKKLYTEVLLRRLKAHQDTGENSLLSASPLKFYRKHDMLAKTMCFSLLLIPDQRFRFPDGGAVLLDVVFDDFCVPFDNRARFISNKVNNLRALSDDDEHFDEAANALYNSVLLHCMRGVRRSRHEAIVQGVMDDAVLWKTVVLFHLFCLQRSKTGVSVSTELHRTDYLMPLITLEEACEIVLSIKCDDTQKLRQCTSVKMAFQELLSYFGHWTVVADQSKHPLARFFSVFIEDATSSYNCAFGLLKGDVKLLATICSTALASWNGASLYENEVSTDSKGPSISCFRGLFVTNWRPYELYDQLVYVRLPHDKRRKSMCSLVSRGIQWQSVPSDAWQYATQKAGYEPSQLNCWAKLETILSTGLSDRVSCCRILQLARTDKDGFDESAGFVVVLGLVYNRDEYTRFIDKGPESENDKAAAAFRAFWGEDLAHIRRFQDGLTLECVALLDTDDERQSLRNDNRAARRTLSVAIVDHVVARHLKPNDAGKCAVYSPQTAVDAVLRPNVRHPESFSGVEKLKDLAGATYGTGEDFSAAAMTAFEGLSTLLQKVSGQLSLSLVSVRLSANPMVDLQATLPTALADILEHTSPPSVLDDEPLPHLSRFRVPPASKPNVVPPFIKRHVVICSVQTSSSWPKDNREASRRVRAALHIQLFENLLMDRKARQTNEDDAGQGSNRKRKLAESRERAEMAVSRPSHPSVSFLRLHADFVDICFDGYPFRVALRCQHELASLTTSVDGKGLSTTIDHNKEFGKLPVDAKRWLLDNVTIPMLSERLGVVMSQSHCLLSPATRLFKLWLHRNLMANHLPEGACDWLCAALFADRPAGLFTLQPPLQSLPAFLRVFKLVGGGLARLDSEALIVDTGNSLSEDERSRLSRVPKGGLVLHVPPNILHNQLIPKSFSNELFVELLRLGEYFTTKIVPKAISNQLHLFSTGVSPLSPLLTKCLLSGLFVDRDPSDFDGEVVLSPWQDPFRSIWSCFDDNGKYPLADPMLCVMKARLQPLPLVNFNPFEVVLDKLDRSFHGVATFYMGGNKLAFKLNDAATRPVLVRQDQVSGSMKRPPRTSFGGKDSVSLRAVDPDAQPDDDRMSLTVDPQQLMGVIRMIVGDLAES